jgi:hypothetical protein
MFMRSLVQILALKQSDRFSGIPQSLESNAGIVSQIKRWLLHFTFFIVQYMHSGLKKFPE